MENTYYLYISPSVFIWRKKDKCLFYDSEKFKSKLFVINNTIIDSIINKLLNIDNLYCIDIKEVEYENDMVKEFILQLTSQGMGELIKKKKDNSRKPIQFPPVLNLQTDVNKLKVGVLTDLTIGENILENLHEVQVVFPSKVDSNYVSSLALFFDSLYGSNTNRIYLSNYTPKLNHYTYLWEQLNKLRSSKILIFRIDEITDNLIQYILQIGLSNMKIRIIVPLWELENCTEQIYELFDNTLFSQEWEFQVSSDKEYYELGEILEILKFDQNDITVKPIYNGENISFFEKYIFLNEEDILNFVLTKRNIYAHQAINTYNFGKLTITSNGEIYANLNQQPLGTIKDDVRELVFKEMSNGNSWLKIRNMKPCCDCIYQWLCPSLSDYEHQIGKPNLCSVRI